LQKHEIYKVAKSQKILNRRKFCYQFVKKYRFSMTHRLQHYSNQTNDISRQLASYKILSAKKTFLSFDIFLKYNFTNNTVGIMTFIYSLHYSLVPFLLISHDSFGSIRAQIYTIYFVLLVTNVKKRMLYLKLS